MCGRKIAYTIKVRFQIVTALLLIMLILPSCAKEKNKTEKQFGGTLIWGVFHKPTIINPIFTHTGVSTALLDLLFNKLVRINSKGGIEPDLAQKWDISSDGLEYTFYLRKGVKFHDGVECTAYDVKFTYDKIINPDVGSPFRFYFKLVNSIILIDKYTLKIILKKPSVYFIYSLLKEICPKHILENSDLKTCDFNFIPTGTGPFKFKEWTEDNQITLEYNPDYYEGRAYLDNIIVKTYPTSKDIWRALMRGEVDFVLFLEREDYEIIKNDTSFKSFAIPCDYYYAIHYNPEDSILKDKRIRKAIAHRIDRKELIEKIEGGYGLECNGPFYPESQGYNHNVKPFEYNPEKSLQILKQAKWKDKDGDGILEKNEKDLEINLLVDERKKTFIKIAMIIRQELQEIGIKLKVLMYNDEEELTKEFIGKNKPNSHLKLFLANYPDIIAEHWSSREPKRFDKLWKYKNNEVDRLFESGEITFDKKKRENIYREIHKIIYEEQPACFLYFPYQFHGISNKFDNVDNFFTVNMPFYTMKGWILKERR